VLGKLGVSAERCLFVDDSEENLAAAHRLGITPLLALDEEVVAADLRNVLGLPNLQELAYGRVRDMCRQLLAKSLQLGG
jgi:FMN phosphatase YigB (HAD superfamily)